MNTEKVLINIIPCPSFSIPLPSTNLFLFYIYLCTTIIPQIITVKNRIPYSLHPYSFLYYLLQIPINPIRPPPNSYQSHLKYLWDLALLSLMPQGTPGQIEQLQTTWSPVSSEVTFPMVFRGMLLKTNVTISLPC